MIPNCSISSIELADSCELLSELYFYLWFPTFSLNHSGASTLWIAFRIVFLLMIPNQQTKKNKSSVLWIAFRIVFLLMIPNLWKHQMILYFVVNCFQNCIFTYDSQPSEKKEESKVGCELLSELYFYLWFPTQLVYESGRVLLWIAFRIVFLLMIPNKTKTLQVQMLVVNCFQNCIFTYDSQRIWKNCIMPICCELLSELYFYLWFPT